MTPHRWEEIEGLRAWLAWTVVIAHCVQFSDLHINQLFRPIHAAGPICVFIFVIISGFVIANLVLERQDDYAPYIVKRFMRIYPLFIVSCVLGAVALPIYLNATSHLGWAVDTPELVWKIVSSYVSTPWAHILAHAVMLHGAIPDSALQSSQYAFMPPAWSLSLEWQFYLIAPFAIRLATKPVGMVRLFAIATICAFVLAHSPFRDSAIVFRFAPLFAIGIASRIFWPVLNGKIDAPWVVAAGSASLIPFAGQEITAALIWTAFVSFLCARPEQPIFRLAFRSSLALFWGARSYSVYLLHFVAICLASYLAALMTSRQMVFFGIVTCLSVALTAILSALAYHYIEKPGIRLGRSIAARISCVAPPRLAGEARRSG